MLKPHLDGVPNAHPAGRPPALTFKGMNSAFQWLKDLERPMTEWAPWKTRFIESEKNKREQGKSNRKLRKTLRDWGIAVSVLLSFLSFMAGLLLAD